MATDNLPTRSDQPTSHRDRLAKTPVVGTGLVKVHDATAALRPTEDDSTAMVVIKRAGQAGLVTAAASVIAVSIL
jgi:hypothetical protein